MKKLIAILSSIMICVTVTACSGIESKTTVTSHVTWSTGDRSGEFNSAYVVVDGEYIEVSPYDVK